jgi:hypothetical protein
VGKLKILKTLSDQDIAYVKKQKTLKLPGPRAVEVPEKGRTKMQLAAQRRQKMHKIYEVARKEISDLKVLAEFLTEDQLGQIFTEEELGRGESRFLGIMPLFNAIFLGYISPQDYMNNDPERLPPDQRPEVDETVLEKRRKRLLPLCYELISILDTERFSRELAGPELRSVTALESSILPGLRAIYYRNMIPEKKKSAGNLI